MNIRTTAAPDQRARFLLKSSTVLVGSMLPFLLFSPTSYADDDSIDDTPVVVVIGKKPRPIDDVVGSASVIDRKQMDRYLSQDLSGLVRYETGVNVEMAGTRFGQSGLSIRGIGGNRVAMEIDGIPIADQFDIGSYSYSARNLVELEDLQQVEILRGPASSIYGSDAIGGVVNFISKKPLDLLSETQSDVFLGVKTGFNSADQSHLATVQTAMAQNQFSVLMSLTQRQGHRMDYSAASNVNEDRQDNKAGSKTFYSLYDIDHNHQVGFRYQSIAREAETNIQSILGLGRFANTSYLWGDDESHTELMSLNYDFHLDSSWLSGGMLRLYQQDSETQQFTDEDRSSRGTPYRYDRDFYYQQNIDGLRVNLYSLFAGDQLNHDIWFWY